MKKGEIQKLIIDHLREEEFISDEEVELVESAATN